MTVRQRTAIAAVVLVLVAALVLLFPEPAGRHGDIVPASTTPPVVRSIP